MFDIFPTHDPDDRQDLLDMMVYNWRGTLLCGKQPYHRLRDYFGEEIAIYFLFLGRAPYACMSQQEGADHDLFHISPPRSPRSQACVHPQ